MKKWFSLILCLLLAITVFAGCGDATQTQSPSPDNSATISPTATPGSDDEKEQLMESLREEFLAKADEVVVDEDSVTFQDASAADTITIQKNPEETVNLYASFTTLWYEAGGTVVGCIGGSTSQELYEEYIGRDITADENMTVVANSSSASRWDVESIIALQPDLIICSTAMSGYSTIQAPAEAAGIPVIAVEYNDFSDYLKWFKVFCNLNDQAELWDTVAMKALDEVVEVLAESPTEDNPTVFSMFASGDELQANTSNTVVGGMISALNGVNIADNWENSTGAERLDINIETVYAANPEIILVQCHAGEEDARELVETIYGDNPVWQSLDAVQNGRVYYLEKTLFHNKPNSRFAEAYQKLAAILYPDVEFSFQAE